MPSQPTKRPKQASFKPSSQPIPTPFTQAPPELSLLLDHLEKSQVYITHIDRHPPLHKRNIFLIPVLLNFTVALLLAVRAFYAVPKYYAWSQAVFGVGSADVRLDTATTTRGEQVRVLLLRTLMMLADFLLFRFTGPWPLTFFLETPSNPVQWRWALWFRAEEVVVRMSRGWGAAELMEGVRAGQENAFFKTRVLPAIERAQMAKTGYLMMDRSWDLDFEYMVLAHELVERGEMGMEVLDKMVLVFLEGTGWVGWRWETGGDVVEDRRKKVVAFKERLTALGKESLFWRWTEIVEKERGADGGFTQEEQVRVAEKVKADFEKEGVDFEEVVKSIGGLD